MIKMNSCKNFNETHMLHRRYLCRTYVRKRNFHFGWFVTYQIFSFLNIKNWHFIYNSISCSYLNRYWTEPLCPWILTSTYFLNLSMTNRILSWTSRLHIFSSFRSNSKDWNVSQLFLWSNRLNSLQTWQFNGLKTVAFGGHSVHLININVASSNTSKERTVTVRHVSKVQNGKYFFE
jgi:hypothetical protein